MQSRLQGPVSRKSRKRFGPEEPFVRSYLVKGLKIKISAKFQASRRLRLDDTKRSMSPEMRPKKFGTFEKRATDM